MGADKAWKCFFAEYSWPVLPVPTFFHEYLYDVANQVRVQTDILWRLTCQYSCLQLIRSVYVPG